MSGERRTLCGGPSVHNDISACLRVESVHNDISACLCVICAYPRNLYSGISH